MISLKDNLKKKRMITGGTFGALIIAAGATMGVDEELILQLEAGLGAVVIAVEGIVDCVRAKYGKPSTIPKDTTKETTVTTTTSRVDGYLQ